MKSCIKKQIKHVAAFFIAFVAFVFICKTNVFAENLALTYNYGIKNVAKDNSNLPIRLYVENKDSQAFKGYMTINVYENNHSVFVYRIDLDIPEKATVHFDRNITISNAMNTITIDVYNRREEIVTSERTNIDLSFYEDKFLVGVVTSDFSSLSYLNDIILENTNLQTQLLELDIDSMAENKQLLDVVDMLILTGLGPNQNVGDISQQIYSFLSKGKPVVICADDSTRLNNVPEFLKNYVRYDLYDVSDRFKYTNAVFVEDKEHKYSANVVRLENWTVIFTNYSLNSLKDVKGAGKSIVGLLQNCFDNNYLMKVSRLYNSQINNDYYNIGNLLNMIDKYKLPDIFILTVLLIFYISFLTIIIYVFLRNINKREYYTKCVIVFSIIYTFIMFSIGYSIMKKNTFLTYLSIVNIKDSNAKEMAFLNFRTSESGKYSFDTSSDISIVPILKNNTDPIVSYNFMNKESIKSTTFTENDDRISISVDNAQDFDSNVFMYENDSYLNDVYNIEASFKRYDGEVVGRISNNMNVNLKNVSLLLYGKVLKIGDIDANHSISLSRANVVNSPINNTTMMSEILINDTNRNVVKYYLDENLLGYFDYGLLFGFIDDNKTLDIDSNDIGDVYGRTLIVTKVNSNSSASLQTNDNANDYCSLKNNVNTLTGYYDQYDNTIDGNEEIVNEYSFDKNINIAGLYLENMDSYDYGKIEFNVPFYGEISIYNYNTNSYDDVQNFIINNDNLYNYVSSDNKVIIKFNPLNRDPLYRKISLPILRAITIA